MKPESLIEINKTITYALAVFLIALVAKSHASLWEEEAYDGSQITPEAVLRSHLRQDRPETQELAVWNGPRHDPEAGWILVKVDSVDWDNQKFHAAADSFPKGESFTMDDIYMENYQDLIL